MVNKSNISWIKNRKEKNICVVSHSSFIGELKDGKWHGDPRPNVFGHDFSPLVDRQGIVNGKDLGIVMLWQGKEIIGLGSKRKANEK